MENRFRLFEEHVNFEYNVKYSKDQKIKASPKERTIIQDWNLDGVKVISAEGEIMNSFYHFAFELSDGTELFFAYTIPERPGSFEDFKMAQFQIKAKGAPLSTTQTFDDMFDDYMNTEGWANGMLALGVLNLYEDFKVKKIGHYVGKNYGI